MIIARRIIFSIATSILALVILVFALFDFASPESQSPLQLLISGISVTYSLVVLCISVASFWIYKEWFIVFVKIIFVSVFVNIFISKLFLAILGNDVITGMTFISIAALFLYMISAYLLIASSSKSEIFLNA